MLSSRQIFLWFCEFIGYLFILIFLVLVWTKYLNQLYIYRDGEYNLWISLKYVEWANPFDLTAINPIQGMTSMLVSINPYFDPAQWVFFSNLSGDLKILLSYAIYAFEVMVSTLLLGLTLGFTRLHSFLASIFAVFLLFPPINYLFGLQAWLAGAPTFAHTLALSNLCLIAYLKLGVEGKKNIFYIVSIILLFFALLIVAPFYNAGILLGTIIALTCIVFSSSTRKEFYWRIAAGLIVLLSFYLVGLPQFYAASKIYSVRFLQNQSFISFHWPMNLKFNHHAINTIKTTLCSYGLYCPAFPRWPFSMRTTGLNLAIIFGGIIGWLTLPLRPARIGLFLAIIWVLILLSSSLSALGILTIMFAPVYFFLMLYSLVALYSSYLLALPIKFISSRFKLEFSEIQYALIALTLAFIIALYFASRFHAGTRNIGRILQAKNETQSLLLETRHDATSIIKILRKEIALFPGKPFRGIVATIYGSPEGSLRKTVHVRQTKFVESGQFEEFLQAAKESGSTHDLLDLWVWNIPTLSEYGQSLSRPLTFYTSKLLSSLYDAADTNFAFPHAANIEILQAMGVRFVIIDKLLNQKEVILRQRLQAGKAEIFLYELTSPNLGNYSPTHLVSFKNVTDFYQQMKANPKLLQTDVFVNEKLNVKLTPAYNAKMIYQKNGIHVTAKSKNTSALLLPIQFSHCYQIKSSTKAKVIRANLIHTLVIFEKNLDMDLKWKFNWRHSECRKQDAMDTKEYL